MMKNAKLTPTTRSSNELKTKRLHKEIGLKRLHDETNVQTQTEFCGRRGFDRVIGSTSGLLKREP